MAACYSWLPVRSWRHGRFPQFAPVVSASARVVSMSMRRLPSVPFSTRTFSPIILYMLRREMSQERVDSAPIFSLIPCGSMTSWQPPVEKSYTGTPRSFLPRNQSRHARPNSCCRMATSTLLMLRLSISAIDRPLSCHSAPFGHCPLMMERFASGVPSGRAPRPVYPQRGPHQRVTMWPTMHDRHHRREIAADPEPGSTGNRKGNSEPSRMSHIRT